MIIYECAKNVSPLAKRILKRLASSGCVIFYYDDSKDGNDVRLELLEVAHHVGIHYHESPNKIVLWDSAIVETFKNY